MRKTLVCFVVGISVMLSAQTDVCDKANIAVDECKYQGGIYCALAARDLLGCEGSGESLLAFLFAVKACFDEESNGCNEAGIIMAREKKYDLAEAFWKRALTAKKRDSVKEADARFNLASLYATRKDLKKAMYHLRAALQKNRENWKGLESDPDFQELRDTKEFKDLIREGKKRNLLP